MERERQQGREETSETWSMDIRFTRVPFSCAGRWQNIWLQCQQLHTSPQNLPTGHTEPRAPPRSLEMHGTTLRWLVRRGKTYQHWIIDPLSMGFSNTNLLWSPVSWKGVICVQATTGRSSPRIFRVKWFVEVEGVCPWQNTCIHNCLARYLWACKLSTHHLAMLYQRFVL